ncbi:MAG: hypothetical protein JXJ20_00495 [Anaerolineae bacterium]|jgi:hypothetical protein|nr:hypothetical protein [Anaerolineae bacterium]
MTREPLERLLENVSDEELESLRDAILREEGRRRSQFHLTITAPYPPLIPDNQAESAVTRWAKLLAWLAKDVGVTPASGKRGVSIRLVFATAPPDPRIAGILLQHALVEAGLLRGRAPEWMDATQTELEPGEADAVHIDLWEKPGSTHSG